MIAEFDWWLLLVGLVFGAGLTWLVVSDSRRRDEDLDEAERASEAAWIAARLRSSRRRIDAALVSAILAEHRGYLAAPPPDPDPRPGREELATPGDAAAGSQAEPDPGRATDPDSELVTESGPHTTAGRDAESSEGAAEDRAVR